MEREIKKVEPYLERINQIRINQSLVSASQPLNEVEGFAKFLTIKDYSPRFVYSSQNQPEILNKLTILRRIKDKFSKEDVNIDIKMLVEGIIKRKENILDGLLNIGKSGIREISSKVYGAPSFTTYNIAIDMASNIHTTSMAEKNIDALRGKEIFEDVLKSMGLDNWKVNIIPNRIAVYVDAGKKKMLIPQHRKFSPPDIKRLIVHEIGTHVFRAENASLQKYRILRSIFPYYLKTEEGLALYNEFRTGYMDVSNLKEYALRYIAVYNMYHLKSFRDTFHILKEFGAGDREAWRITLRAYRGGGLVKDHVYLEGFLTVRNFLETHPKYENLIMCCLSGTEHKNIIEEMYRYGLLSYPKHTLSQILSHPVLEENRESIKPLSF